MLYQVPSDLYLFFFYLDFFHNHSRITGLQRKEEGISLTPPYHFNLIFNSTCFTDTQRLAKRLLQRAHLCTMRIAGLEPGNFGFRVKVANHEATLTTKLRVLQRARYGFTTDNCPIDRPINFYSKSYVFEHNERFTFCHVLRMSVTYEIR